MRYLFVLAMVLAACLSPLPPPPPLDSGTPPPAVDAGCSPANCTGCCQGNVCEGGNLDEACGYDGQRCRQCPADHECGGPGACYVRPWAPSDAGDDDDDGGWTDPTHPHTR